MTEHERRTIDSQIQHVDKSERDRISNLSTENTVMVKKTSNTTTARVVTKPEETKLETFSRLATGRTNKAIKAIALIAQLTGSAYESSDESRKAIVLALKTSVQHVEDSFDGKTKASDGFKLPS